MNEIDRIERYPYHPENEMEFDSMRREVNLLSGRVELMLRVLSRLVAKIDPGFLDDPHDPNVKRRSDLLGETVLEKLRAEALAQASSDPEHFAKLNRYFKDLAP